MSLVSGNRESEWVNSDNEKVTTYWIELDGEKEVPCYQPEGKDLKLNEPLPAGWEVKLSKKGKEYLAPPRKQGGGGGFGGKPAWTNTEAGAAFVQERMDRRTALMQAVVVKPESWQLTAEAMYEWLRKASGVGAVSPSSLTPAPDPSPRSTPEGKAQSGGTKVDGEATSPSAECLHVETTTLKPDGSALPKTLIRCIDCGVVFKE